MKRFTMLLTVLVPLLSLAILFYITSLQTSASSLGSGTMITVNSTADLPDVAPGNGICETAVGNNECTLRAAINEANALSTDDTIALPANNYTLTYALAPGFEGVDLEITDDLTIVGEDEQNTVVSSDTSVGIFRISSAVTVTLQDFTVRDGQIYSSLGHHGGAAVQNNGGNIRLINMRLLNNTANSIGSGAILNRNGGTITIENSIIAANTALSSGGITNEGNSYMAIVGSTIEDNAAGDGGGIVNSGTLELIDSIVRDNNATSTSASGGGIRNFGVLTITHSMVISNTASGGGGSYGGGIRNFADAQMLLQNSTVAYNTASQGGGINNSGNMQIINSTISNNSIGAGIYQSGTTAVFTLTNSTVTQNDWHNITFSGSFTDGFWLQNSIVANPTGGNDCSSASTIIVSLDHNLDSDGSCNLDQPNDLPAMDPFLEVLGNNGDTTLTHALTPLSPAVDAANDLVCPETDQRGVSRSQGLHCDIGAYESPYLASQHKIFLPMIFKEDS